MTFSQLKSAIYAKRVVTFSATYCVPGVIPVHNVKFCIMYRVSALTHYVLLYNTGLLVRPNFVMSEEFCLANGYKYAVGYRSLDSMAGCFSDIELLDSDLTLYDFVEM